ncbi:MAG: type II toxin-antitoxin system RelE/ParE family toxin [Saprospiraceae bacterium]|nr:type II toxin-antitoxin system RelE/ParE family toxin [Saprospiraceae bacterium]
MADYKLTIKAVEDLNDIWEYTIEQWSEEQADKYYNLLLNSFQDIANNPDVGKRYDGIGKDLFGIKSNRHIIFHRKLVDKPIEITRILHG